MADESSRKARLQLLGRFGLFGSGGQEVPVSAKKNRALLAALALAPNGSLMREDLAALLWGDRAEAQARRSLRQALTVLRKEVAQCGVKVDPSGDKVRIDLGSIVVDAVLVRQAAATADPELVRLAAESGDGTLLADLGLHGASIDDWLAAERRRHTGAMLTVLELCSATQTGAARVELLERLVALDPLREASHRALMQALADAGETALALKQYDACRARLDDDLSVAPAQETRALRARIARGAVSPAPASTAKDVRPSIALLPFANRNGDAQTGVLCDAFTDAIIAGLARFRDLRVTAAESSFAYRGRSIAVPEAARAFGVHFILEGSVLRLDGLIRVTAALADGGDGAALWTQTFDRRDGDLSSVLDGITGQIVAQLASAYGGGLAREWRRLSFHAEEKDLRAYDHFQRGLAAYNTFTPGSTAQARKEFNAALALRPGYGKPLAKVAWSHITDITAGWSRDVDADLAAAHRFAMEAIASEDGESWGYWALAGWHMTRLEHDQAIAACKKALALNPNDADVWTDYGYFLNFAGRHDEALKSVAHAMTLNPHYLEWWLMERGQFHFDAHNYEEAVADLTSLELMASSFVETYLAAALAALGRNLEAKASVRRLLAFAPSETVASATEPMRAPYARDKDRDHLAHWLRIAGLPD
ncbi:tetratricopeptide repeat protein [Defluviimonas sp. WL0002]|uniref:Tetratricopeptide repeat protein n=1 Tax=Albidovulum marisflavi TaxID=2984159 RepID=A0ABT2ZES8_9RHOB|nr:BTAD domain-containing putative transcriptional regulator [Defluviimonas sp. WL0002]MCV2869599.1 tetratricopeptide repeat protein [Defluviimonas sp. WL0002]